MKIFGREPSALIGVIQAIILMLGVLVHWSADQIGALALVVIVLGDVFLAWVTHATMLAVAIGLIKAVVAAMASFGLDLDAAQVGAFIGLSTAVLGFYQRTQTFPVYDPPQAPAGAVAVAEVGAK